MGAQSSTVAGDDGELAARLGRLSPEIAADVAAVRADVEAARASPPNNDGSVAEKTQVVAREKTQAQWEELTLALVESVAEAE